MAAPPRRPLPRLPTSWPTALADHVADLGFTHVELLPPTEHPYGPSWGYQVTGYFAPTARLGDPDGFRRLVDHLHRRGIGVIVDWVPAHFPKDDWALARFDGTALYEHADPRQGEHPDWGTLVFNYGRTRCATSSSPTPSTGWRRCTSTACGSTRWRRCSTSTTRGATGEWVPNRHGGRENLEAIAFLQEMNTVVHARHPRRAHRGRGVDRPGGRVPPVDAGGLGFTQKWNMGWMHDTLEYFSTGTRCTAAGTTTSSPSGSPTRGPRTSCCRSATTRWCTSRGRSSGRCRATTGSGSPTCGRCTPGCGRTPGKQLLFMGGELAQEQEWSHDRALDWFLLDDPPTPACATCCASSTGSRRRCPRSGRATRARPASPGSTPTTPPELDLRVPRLRRGGRCDGAAGGGAWPTSRRCPATATGSAAVRRPWVDVLNTDDERGAAAAWSSPRSRPTARPGRANPTRRCSPSRRWRPLAGAGLTRLGPSPVGPNGGWSPSAEAVTTSCSVTSPRSRWMTTSSLLTPQFAVRHAGLARGFGRWARCTTVPRFVEGELGGGGFEVASAWPRSRCRPRCCGRGWGASATPRAAGSWLMGRSPTWWPCRSSASGWPRSCGCWCPPLTTAAKAAMFVGVATAAQDWAAPAGRGSVRFSSRALRGPGGRAVGEALVDHGFTTVWLVLGLLASGRAGRLGIPRAQGRAAPTSATAPASSPTPLWPGLILFLGLIPFTAFAAFAPLYATRSASRRRRHPRPVRRAGAGHPHRRRPAARPAGVAEGLDVRAVRRDGRHLAGRGAGGRGRRCGWGGAPGRGHVADVPSLFAAFWDGRRRRSAPRRRRVLGCSSTCRRASGPRSSVWWLLTIGTSEPALRRGAGLRGLWPSGCCARASAGSTGRRDRRRRTGPLLHVGRAVALGG